jgi:hypothetical protein
MPATVWATDIGAGVISRLRPARARWSPRKTEGLAWRGLRQSWLAAAAWPDFAALPLVFLPGLAIVEQFGVLLNHWLAYSHAAPVDLIPGHGGLR